MAESYFELLTEQQGFPAKPFDPVEEVKRLRQMLAARLQQPQQQECLEHREPAVETCVLPVPEEPVSLGSIMATVDGMRKTLAICQRSRFPKKRSSGVIFRSRWRHPRKQPAPSVAAPNTDSPPESLLEQMTAGLMALGVIGVVFGALAFFRGLESDLSLGTLVCTSGAAIVTIGISGRLLAFRESAATKKPASMEIGNVVDSRLPLLHGV